MFQETQAKQANTVKCDRRRENGELAPGISIRMQATQGHVSLQVNHRDHVCNALVIGQNLESFTSISDNKVESNSFLSPQWGGIYIYNVAPPSANSTLPEQKILDMGRIMEVFLAQFRLLLNLHTQASSVAFHYPSFCITVKKV